MSRETEQAVIQRRHTDDQQVHEQRKIKKNKMSRETEQAVIQRRHTDDQQVHEKVLNITNHQGNANRNLNETSLPICQDGYYVKGKRVTSVGNDVEKKEPLCTVGKNANWCSLYDKQYGSFSKT